MTNKILTVINKYNMLENCKNIVVGISGGSDSVCLLFALSAIIKEHYKYIKITAAHVNHLIRGESADGDEKFVENLCASAKIPLKIKRVCVTEYAAKNNMSVEMAGRHIRYEFFNEVAYDMEMCKIAVAHNLNDRAETVLLNIIRGTGISGLKGIPYVRDNIIRPLLDITKKEIKKYCADNKLDIREDESNFENNYTRNKIRLDLIPYINENFDVNITEKLIRLSNNIMIEDDFINAYTQSFIEKCVDKDNKILYLKDFIPLHNTVKIRILQSLCDNNLEHCHMDKIINFINTGNTGKIFEIPGNIFAKKEYDKVVFGNRKDIKKKFEVEYSINEIIKNGTLHINELSIDVSCELIDNIKDQLFKKFSNNSLKMAFDYDKIKNGKLRNRRAGDIFKPYKGMGSKKLSKYFIDEKIAVDAREEKLLIAQDNDIAWVVGMCPGKDFLPNENTKKILIVIFNPIVV